MVNNTGICENRIGAPWRRAAGQTGAVGGPLKPIAENETAVMIGSPSATGGVGQQPGEHMAGSPGIIDAQRIQHKSQLLKIACDIAAVAQRYKKIHHTLFGFSMRRVLHTMQHNELADFAALKIELDSIEVESKLVLQAIDDTGLRNLPKHANTIATIRDALKIYAETVSRAALKLKLICQNLHRESTRETGFADYSASQFQQDKAAYDATVQEFRRRGTQLTGLFEKL